MGNNVPPEKPVFRSAVPVTLLGGGALGAGDLEAALALAPRLVAADGGAVAALAAGKMPEAIYGDLDSLPPEVRARVPPETIHEITEQDSTDFDKALCHIEAPLVLAAGFAGARVDHELAVYHGLVARAGHRCIVLGGRDLVLHAPPDLTLDLPAGARVSLFPLARVSGRDTGLEWPIEGLSFHPAGRIGTSNRARGGPIRLIFDAPGMLLILPRTYLATLAAALSRASVWSRAPDLGSV